jgi:hypothetical protein
VTITAKHADHPNYSESYIAKIRVKYDCIYLDDKNYFLTPSSNSLKVYRNWKSSTDTGVSETTDKISFKIGDPDLVIAGFNFWS